MSINPLNNSIITPMRELARCSPLENLAAIEAKLKQLPTHIQFELTNQIYKSRCISASVTPHIPLPPPSVLTVPEMHLSIHNYALNILRALPPNIFAKLHYRFYQINSSLPPIPILPSMPRMEPIQSIARQDLLLHVLEVESVTITLDEWVSRNGGTRNVLIAAQQIKQFMETPSTTLSLEGLNLTDLPEVFGAIVIKEKLRSLDLSGNNFEKLPDSIKSLQALDTINLANNPFQEIPEVIYSCKNLQSLDLSGTLIQDLSYKLKDLSLLNKLQANNLENLQFVDPELMTKDLHLQNCPNIFAIQENILSFYNDSPYFETVLKKLEQFEVNQLAEIVNEWASTQEFGEEAKKIIIGFLTTPGMKQLNLQNFNLTSLPDIFSSLACRTRLESLVLKFNPLSELPESLFYAANLQTLVISKSEFTEFPKVIFSLPSTCKVSFKDQNLTSKDIYDAAASYVLELDAQNTFLDSYYLIEQMQKQHCEEEIYNWIQYEGFHAQDIGDLILYTLADPSITELDLSPYTYLTSYPVDTLNSVAITKRGVSIYYPQAPVYSQPYLEQQALYYPTPNYPTYSPQPSQSHFSTPEYQHYHLPPYIENS